MQRILVFIFVSVLTINAGSLPSPSSTGGTSQKDTPTASGQDIFDKMFLTTNLKQISTLIYGKKYKAAIKKLRNLEYKYPQNADIENYLGFSYRKLGDLGKSALHYENALRINPRHIGALEYQGELFISYKQFEKAKRNLEIIKRICSKNCEEYLELKVAIEKAK